MKQKNIRIEKQREIAYERVEKLLKLAAEDTEKADRYVALARKISMKVNLRLPSSLKRKFCKNCGTFFRPGTNCRIRTRNSRLICYCFKCKHTYRMPFLREKKSKT